MAFFRKKILFYALHVRALFTPFFGASRAFFCKRRTACSLTHVQASHLKIFRPKKVPCFFFPNPKPSVFRSCNIGLEECTAASSNRAAVLFCRQAIFQLPSPNDMLCTWSDGHCHILQPSHTCAYTVFHHSNRRATLPRQELTHGSG